jgi:hypothetical protein
LQTPAEKKEGTKSYAKPQNRKKYLSLCTEPQQRSKSRQKVLQQTSAEKKAQKAKAHGFYCRERSKQKHRSIRDWEGHERERERGRGLGERENLVQGFVVRNSVRVADLDGAIGRERS